MADLLRRPANVTAIESLKVARVFVPITACALCVLISFLPLFSMAGFFGAFLGIIGGITLGRYASMIVISLMEALIAILESEIAIPDERGKSEVLPKDQSS